MAPRSFIGEVIEGLILPDGAASANPACTRVYADPHRAERVHGWNLRCEDIQRRTRVNRSIRSG